MITTLSRVLNTVPNGLMRSRLSQMHRQLVQVGLPVLLSFGMAVMGIGLWASSGLAIAVADVPNPREVNGGWVTDMADLISDEGEQQLNQIIGELEASNGAEIAVVTVLNTQPSASPKAFATKLFNTWGIGKAGEDNGVLFLVSKNERRTEIETGYGIESLLTDDQAGQILRNQVTPEFKQGNFEIGIVNGVTSIAARLKGDNTPESALNDSLDVMPGQSYVPGGLFWGLLGWLTPLRVFIPLLILTLFGLRKRLKWPSPLGVISPVGRTEIPSRHWIYDLWVMTLRGLGNEAANGLKDHPGPVQELVERRLTRLWGWLALGIALVAALTFASTDLSFMGRMLLFASGWFCLEVGLSYLAAWQTRRLPRPSLSVTFFSLIATLFGLCFLSLFSGPLAPALLCGSFAALALALRSRRQQFSPPRCAICAQRSGLNAPQLRRLSPAELRSHLSSEEQSELMRYEAYHCPVCHPFSATPTDGFKLHLFSHHLLKKTLEDCPACEAPTLDVEAFLEAAPTKKADGKQLRRQFCHCCDYQKETTHVMKYLKPVRRSYRSRSTGHGTWGGGYSSGGYSGGDYSGGGGYSGSSGGSSFGGGESGGGGAGESW